MHQSRSANRSTPVVPSPVWLQVHNLVSVSIQRRTSSNSFFLSMQSFWISNSVCFPGWCVIGVLKLTDQVQGQYHIIRSPVTWLARPTWPNPGTHPSPVTVFLLIHNMHDYGYTTNDAIKGRQIIGTSKPDAIGVRSTRNLRVYWEKKIISLLGTHFTYPGATETNPSL